MPRFFPCLALALLALFSVSCGGSSAPTDAKPGPSAAAPAQPAIPADVQTAAESVLGNEAEVLAFGDLARTGSDQFLAVNRLKAAPEGAVPGTLITRLAVVEKDGGKWKEVLRCDEHLKNTHGYLGGTPLAEVPAWRLQYEQDAQKGLMLYFTPLAKPAGGYIQTIGVRWNPKVNRYESLDRNYEAFLGETQQLATPQSVLR
ncbi:MAG TPA: hypothetical protein VMJ93_09125 [Verrucomicrobiae bacterium]|nr:hypothetical protein [Verrucomicrobiae bacterium]